MDRQCPKCGKASDSAVQCSSCGVVFAKFEEYQKAKAAREAKANADAEAKGGVSLRDRSGQNKKVVVKTYRGTEQGASAQFQADAGKLAAQGYYPTAQVWAPGTYGCGAFLVALILSFVFVGVLIFLYMLLVKPDGTLTVTYEFREVAAAAKDEVEANKTCPQCAETVKSAAKICRFCNFSFET